MRHEQIRGTGFPPASSGFETSLFQFYWPYEWLGEESGRLEGLLKLSWETVLSIQHWS